MAKTLSVDFDGVLHSYLSGWQGADKIPDPPVPGAFDWLERLVTARTADGKPRFKVCIFSARNAQPGGIEAMKAWLLFYGLDETLLAQIDFPLTKPSAFLQIDDRAIRFDGRAMPTVDEIDGFRPWYQS